MDTLTLAAAFGRLHRAGIDTTAGLSIDVTGGNLQIRAYNPAAATAVLAVLDDAREVHGWEAFQSGRWHGALAGAVVTLIHVDAEGTVAA